MSSRLRTGSSQTSPVKVPSDLEALRESAPDLPLDTNAHFGCSSDVSLFLIGPDGYDILMLTIRPDVWSKMTETISSFVPEDLISHKNLYHNPWVPLWVGKCTSKYRCKIAVPVARV